jgi:hypothetical protein
MHAVCVWEGGEGVTHFASEGLLDRFGGGGGGVYRYMELAYACRVPLPWLGVEEDVGDGCFVD